MTAFSRSEDDVSVQDHLLTTTRSVRKRLDLTRPVPREVVLDCLRLAIQAPTGGNSQGWRWLVIDDPGVREQVAALTDPEVLKAIDAVGCREMRIYILGNPGNPMSWADMERKFLGLTTPVMGAASRSIM